MKNFFLFALLACTLFTAAQTGDLFVKSSDKGLYVEHKVASKENFYSIGRLYSTSPKEIAAYNGLDMEKGLSLDQTIRIPLTAANFSQITNEGTPVYYTVGENEGLMKVSTVNNKVTLESLRRWNKLSSDKVSAGNKLIVGFINASQSPAVGKQELKSEKDVVVEQKQPEKVKEDKEPVQQKENKIASPKTEVSTVMMDNPTTSETAVNQGYFRTSFDQQAKALPLSKNETVTSGIFKTASGWRDAKYYLLMDAVQPGTIIKITNPANNKIIYAKVLGEMSGIRLNAGLNIRISNAAASALDINEMDKFIVKVNY